MDLHAAAHDAYLSSEPGLTELSDWLYHHPEVGFEEVESSRRLAEWLGERTDVTYPAYGLPTAFEANFGSGDRRVVVCAEYDALPGVGHACGHNLIAASALGVASALAPIVDDLGITLTILGTPAEEAFGGKVDLIDAGAFEGASAAMMVHPAPYDVLDPAILAVRHLEVTYTGRDAHAAFAPQEGINALDAFVQAYVNVSTLRQALYPADKIHGIVTHGGDAPNIIPSRTVSAWYVRADSDARLAELWTRVEACFRAAAEATGCEVAIREHGHPYATLDTNPVLAELFERHASGRRMLRGSNLPVGASGSTDMGNVSKFVPTIHPFLGIDSLPVVNHQPEFAALTLSEAGHRSIRDGALGMAGTIIDLAVEDRWDEVAEAFAG